MSGNRSPGARAGPAHWAVPERYGEGDAALDRAVDTGAVTRRWGELPEREQRILALRFYGNFSREEIAERVGISQMHVCRLLARALSQPRGRLLLGPAAGRSAASESA